MESNSIERLSEPFLSDSVQLSLDLLNDILVSINTVEDLNSQSNDFKNLQLASLSTDISRFVELTTLLAKLIMTTNTKLRADVKESHIQLLFILKAMNQAQQKEDSMALEELIKYELKDNLTLWKIDLIPQTKRLLNT